MSLSRGICYMSAAAARIGFRRRFAASAAWTSVCRRTLGTWPHMVRIPMGRTAESPALHMEKPSDVTQGPHV